MSFSTEYLLNTDKTVGINHLKHFIMITKDRMGSPIKVVMSKETANDYFSKPKLFCRSDIEELNKTDTNMKISVYSIPVEFDNVPYGMLFVVPINEYKNNFWGEVSKL